MISFALSIQDRANPALQKKIGKVNGQRLNSFIGPAVSLLLKRNFLSKGNNKEGWPSTHFWAGAARSTNWHTLADGVEVSVNQIGVRQRYHGGTIKPLNAKFLTIPISPVSYGHVAADFPGLFLLRTPKAAYLVQAGTGVSEKTGRVKTSEARALKGNVRSRLPAALNFLFLLTASVDKKPDPSVLPSQEEITRTALDAAREAIK